MEQFNLTTKNGLSVVQGYLEALAMQQPAYWIYRAAKSFFGTAPTPEQQAKIAEDLIKAGKANGVGEMEIEINKDAGVKLKGKLEGKYDIEISAGRKDTIKMKIKYK